MHGVSDRRNGDNPIGINPIRIDADSLAPRIGTGCKEKWFWSRMPAKPY